MIHQFAIFIKGVDTNFERRFTSTSLEIEQIEKLLLTENIETIFIDENNIVQNANIFVKRYKDPNLFIFMMTDCYENMLVPFCLMEVFVSILKSDIVDAVYVSKEGGPESALKYNFDAVHKIVDSFVVNGKVVALERDEILKCSGLDIKKK